MSASVELEAWMVMTAMLGLGLALSKVKSICRPFLWYAVIGGIPMKIQKTKQNKNNYFRAAGKHTGHLVSRPSPRGPRSSQDFCPTRQTALSPGVRLYPSASRTENLAAWGTGSGHPWTRLSPAAISLNKACEEMPSRRKDGWGVGTEGAGAGVGPPGKKGAVAVWGSHENLYF